MAPLITIALIFSPQPENTTMVGSSGFGLNHVTLQTQGPKYCFSSSLSTIALDWAFTIRESAIECTPNSKDSAQSPNMYIPIRIFSSSNSLALAISNFQEQVHFICFKNFPFAQIFSLAIFQSYHICKYQFIYFRSFFNSVSNHFQYSHCTFQNKPISVNQDLLCMKRF